jgi:hypothetical protein
MLGNGYISPQKAFSPLLNKLPLAIIDNSGMPRDRRPSPSSAPLMESRLWEK